MHILRPDETPPWVIGAENTGAGHLTQRPAISLPSSFRQSSRGTQNTRRKWRNGENGENGKKGVEGRQQTRLPSKGIPEKYFLLTLPHGISPGRHIKQSARPLLSLLLVLLSAPLQTISLLIPFFSLCCPLSRCPSSPSPRTSPARPGRPSPSACLLPLVVFSSGTFSSLSSVVCLANLSVMIPVLLAVSWPWSTG